MTSEMSSSEFTSDSTSGSPRSKYKRKAKKSDRFSDSRHNGSKSNSVNFEAIPEDDSTMVLWSYVGEPSAFRRNKVGAENPFYRVNPLGIILPLSKDSPIFHLPEELLQSVEYRAICYMMKENFSTLHLRGSQWVMTGFRKKVSLDVLNAELHSDVDSSFLHLMHYLIYRKTEFDEGFTNSMLNAVGRRCLEDLLNLAAYVVDGTSNVRGGIKFAVINAGGGSSRHPGNCHLFETNVIEKGFEWTGDHSMCEEKLVQLHKMTKDKSCHLTWRVPDGQCYFEDDSGSEIYLITGVVKSLSTMIMDRDIWYQAWKQALVGLKNMDVSYGLVLSNLYAVLFQIKLDDENKTVTTEQQMFPFVNANYSFNYESFQELFRCLVAILNQYKVT